MAQYVPIVAAPLGVWPLSFVKPKRLVEPVLCMWCRQRQQVQHTLWFTSPEQGQSWAVFCRPTLAESSCVLEAFNINGLHGH
jgi:hypothetical protein